MIACSDCGKQEHLFQHNSEEDGSPDVGSGQIPNDYTLILLVSITCVAYSIKSP